MLVGFCGKIRGNQPPAHCLSGLEGDGKKLSTKKTTNKTIKTAAKIAQNCTNTQPQKKHSLFKCKKKVKPDNHAGCRTITFI